MTFKLKSGLTCHTPINLLTVQNSVLGYDVLKMLTSQWNMWSIR